MNKIEIRCLVNPQCTLGEGPVWDSNQQVLYWTDIVENKIYCCHPEDSSVQSWSTPEHVGFMILQYDGNMIVGLKSGLHHITLRNDTTVTVSRIDRIDENLSHIRFNDGTTDIYGGIWACTMDMRIQEPLGKYFYYDRELRRITVDEGYVVANGPALSPHARFLYTVESIGGKDLTKGVYVSEISSSGKLTNKKMLINWNNKKSHPDGVITDVSGNLWVGEFGGNILRCFAPDGELKHEIPLPAWNITKAAFGGAKGDILYVTSALTGVDDNILEKYPDTGGIIEIKGVEIN